jgi:hypothetical protein
MASLMRRPCGERQQRQHPISGVRGGLGWRAATAGRSWHSSARGPGWVRSTRSAAAGSSPRRVYEVVQGGEGAAAARALRSSPMLAVPSVRVGPAISGANAATRKNGALMLMLYTASKSASAAETGRDRARWRRGCRAGHCRYARRRRSSRRVFAALRGGCGMWPVGAAVAGPRVARHARARMGGSPSQGFPDRAEGCLAGVHESNYPVRRW